MTATPQTPPGEPAPTTPTGQTGARPAVHPSLDLLRDLGWRDLLACWWIDFRRRWRRCFECGRRGYGSSGPGPGRRYRWVDDPIVRALGFETAPIRCNTCGQKAQP